MDGNDIIAVRAAMEDALDRARNGQGASVIEAVTYRLGDHTTADDARRYRGEDEVKEALDQGTVTACATGSEAKGAWDETKEEAWKADATTGWTRKWTPIWRPNPSRSKRCSTIIYAELPADSRPAPAPSISPESHG